MFAKTKYSMLATDLHQLQNAMPFNDRKRDLALWCSCSDYQASFHEQDTENIPIADQIEEMSRAELSSQWPALLIPNQVHPLDVMTSTAEHHWHTGGLTCMSQVTEESIL